MYTIPTLFNALCQVSKDHFFFVVFCYGPVIFYLALGERLKLQLNCESTPP